SSCRHSTRSAPPSPGGAVYAGNGSGLPALEDRSGTQIEEKRAVARAAVARIQDGDSVLLDGGTTTLEVARLLVGRAVQIVTNSLPIAALFGSRHAPALILLPGYSSPPPPHPLLPQPLLL